MNLYRAPNRRGESDWEKDESKDQGIPGIRPDGSTSSSIYTLRIESPLVRYIVVDHPSERLVCTCREVRTTRRNGHG